MNPITPVTRHSVAVIGGGQAGLSISWYLTQSGVDHVVFEKERAGHAWRAERWDSFCLVTPNWQCQLPGFPYRGPDPHGFMLRDEIVSYMDDFVGSFGPPLLEGVAVRHLRSDAQHGFMLDTTDGIHFAEQVVVASGGYQIPMIPRCAERLPADIVQIHSSLYRNPRQLPGGAVLVVGSGQSGCQIAEDLHLAGRKVHLCVGDAPRVARRYRGKDVVEWLHLMGYYDLPVHEHPLREGVRDKTNHYVTGRDGGRDIDLRQRAREGMELYGRLLGRERRQPNVRRRPRPMPRPGRSGVGKHQDQHRWLHRQTGIAAPEEARYRPVWAPPHERAQLDYRTAGITSVVWCIGFRTDYSWLDLPVFNGRGNPPCTRGRARSRRLFSRAPLALYLGLGKISGVAGMPSISRNTSRHGSDWPGPSGRSLRSTKPLSAHEFRFAS